MRFTASGFISLAQQNQYRSVEIPIFPLCGSLWALLRPFAKHQHKALRPPESKGSQRLQQGLEAWHGCQTKLVSSTSFFLPSFAKHNTAQGVSVSRKKFTKKSVKCKREFSMTNYDCFHCSWANQLYSEGHTSDKPFVQSHDYFILYLWVLPFCCETLTESLHLTFNTVLKYVHTVKRILSVKL